MKTNLTGTNLHQASRSFGLPVPAYPVNNQSPNLDEAVSPRMQELLEGARQEILAGANTIYNFDEDPSQPKHK